MMIDEIMETLEGLKQEVEELDDFSIQAKREIQNRIDDVINACDEADVEPEEGEEDDGDAPTED